MAKKRIIAISVLLILLAFLVIIPNAMALESVSISASNQNPIVLPTQSQAGLQKPVEEIPLISEQGYQDYLTKINKSNLTKEEKSYYRELLKNIKDNSSTLTKEEKISHIIDIAYIDHPEDLKRDEQISKLKSHLEIINKSNSNLEIINKSKSNQDNISIDNITDKPMLQWSGYPRGDWGSWSHTGNFPGDVHNYMAYNAGKYIPFDDYWSDRLGAEASDPDKQTLPIPYIHQLNHYVVYGNPTEAYNRAQSARAAYIAGQGDPWVTNLAWSMHYISDAAIPFHYNFDYLDLHAAYENWVGDKWSYSGWKSLVTSDPYFYGIISPYDGAVNLGNEGHQRLINIIGPRMRSMPDGYWQRDQGIIDETLHMLVEAQRHNRGLIYYCSPQ